VDSDVVIADVDISDRDALRLRDVVDEVGGDDFVLGERSLERYDNVVAVDAYAELLDTSKAVFIVRAGCICRLVRDINLVEVIYIIVEI
jgi:hypothetical protein